MAPAWSPKASVGQVYIWLDIFGEEALLCPSLVSLILIDPHILRLAAINQNEGASQGDDLAQLQEVVKDAEQTLMTLDDHGAVLTRVWCFKS